MNNNILYQIALSFFPHFGGVNSRKALAHLGSLEAIFNSKKREVLAIPGFGEILANTLIKQRDEALKRAEAELLFIEKYKLKTFFYLDKDYPLRLSQCEDAPIVLFMRGSTDLNASRIISVVGTRKATDYGRELTENLLLDLSQKGINVLVVSGLAYGIDVMAHKTSLKLGFPTVGVLGHGLDRMYPAAHASVAHEMLQNGGGLLSDFPSGSKIDPGNFLRRNRIVAGLADCTIVVESGEKGGALVTADIASSYNRDVFAFPGKVTDAYSKGCNALIRQNKAALIENADDLINLMGWEADSEPVQQSLIFDLSPDEKQFMAIIAASPDITVDEISREMKMSVQQINYLALNLEFSGLLKALPGNRFKLTQKNFQFAPCSKQ